MRLTFAIAFVALVAAWAVFWPVDPSEDDVGSVQLQTAIAAEKADRAERRAEEVYRARPR
ncbi:MAG: hypothetical protein AB9M53_00675 [Leptothrix sp. (in: b-proteobacteria)]